MFFPCVCIFKFVHPEQSASTRWKGSDSQPICPQRTRAHPSPPGVPFSVLPPEKYFRAWRHQLISIVAQHGPSLSDPPRPFQRKLSKLRGRHSPTLARQNTTADVRKGDIEACVLAPSIPAGRCVGVPWVAYWACRRYHRLCLSQQLAGAWDFYN